MTINHKLEIVRAEINAMKGITKTLVLNDLHVPFHREEEILEIIQKHKHEIDTIVFGGDIVDCEGVSSFPKELRKPLVNEMAVAWKLLNKIDKMTPNVKKILIWGNHEYRFVRYLETKGNELNPFHSSNILQNIVDGFVHNDRYNKVRTKYNPLSSNFVVIDKWYVQHYDLVIAHPKNFSKVNLRTATSTLEHFMAKGWHFNAIFIGHTHKWGSTYKFGKWVGETGCLCMPMDYADTGNVGYTPQDYGYLLATFNNGAIDINESKLFKLALEEGVVEWQEKDLN